MVHSAHIQRSNKVDSSSQPCMKTRKTSSGGVERVKGRGTLIQEMPCDLPTASTSSCSMSGELTT